MFGVVGCLDDNDKYDDLLRGLFSGWLHWLSGNLAHLAGWMALLIYGLRIEKYYILEGCSKPLLILRGGPDIALKICDTFVTVSKRIIVSTSF